MPLDILIVEDDADFAATVAEILELEGHKISIQRDGSAALRWLREHPVDLLICDIRLPGTDGLTICSEIKALRPATSVILMSAGGSINEAVKAIKGDAANYLEKPFSGQELLAAVREVEVAYRYTIARVPAADPSSAIIGSSASIVALREFVRTVAASNGPVLITGETGTGKELVAETIHALSPRRGSPFVAVNCAAFASSLLEAELFGHERGAFTGATHERDGRFRTADGGTLFLDEVGEIDPGAQAKLLRVLESGTLQPVGADHDCEVDVRIISATNRDLRGQDGALFRPDLFYRLKMFHIHMPPLRERMSDLPLLVSHFLSERTESDESPRITPNAWTALTQYDFPGNIRELRHAIEHAVIMSNGGDIESRHLPEEFRERRRATSSDGAIQSLEEAEREFERGYLLRTLESTDWNKTRAAEMLKISRKTLWKKLRDLGITKS